MNTGTIRNIWIKKDLVTYYKRLLRLEKEKNVQFSSGQNIELMEVDLLYNRVLLFCVFSS